MKLFTVKEANDLLPTIIPKLVSIGELYVVIDGLRAEARAAAGASNLGGGMEGGTGYVNTLYQIGKHTTEIHEVGVTALLKEAQDAQGVEVDLLDGGEHLQLGLDQVLQEAVQGG